MILADTHIVLWLSFAPEEISRKATAAIESTRKNSEGLAISDITLLELSMLVSKGRVRLDASLETFLREIESKFVVLPMNSRVCVAAIRLPGTFPKDPADRITTATALTEGLALLTADEHIRSSGVVQTIW